MNEKNLCCDGTYIIEKGILNKYIELDWVKCRGERKLRGERERGKKENTWLNIKGAWVWRVVVYVRCLGKDPPGKMTSEQEPEENLLFLKERIIHIILGREFRVKDKFHSKRKLRRN